MAPLVTMKMFLMMMMILMSLILQHYEFLYLTKMTLMALWVSAIMTH